MKEEEKVLRTYRNFRGDNSNIYKEEQIGDFVIGMTDGFNDTRHIYIHQGEPEHFGHLTSGNSLPYNFQFTPMVSKGNQADSVYNQVKEMARNNPDISPAKIEKQIMYYEKGGIQKGVTYEYPLYFGDESGRQFVAIWYTYEEDRDDADDVFDKLVEEGAGPDEVLLKTGSGKYTKIDPDDLSDDEYELMNYGLQTSSIQGEVYFAKGGKITESNLKKYLNKMSENKFYDTYEEMFDEDWGDENDSRKEATKTILDYLFSLDDEMRKEEMVRIGYLEEPTEYAKGGKLPYGLPIEIIQMNMREINNEYNKQKDKNSPYAKKLKSLYNERKEEFETREYFKDSNIPYEKGGEIEEYYSKVIEKYGKEGAFDRVLRDSQFGKYKNREGYLHNRLNKSARIKGDKVIVSDVQLAVGGGLKYTNEKTFTSPQKLAEYLEEKSIFAKGGVIEVVEYPGGSILEVSMEELKKLQDKKLVFIDDDYTYDTDAEKSKYIGQYGYREDDEDEIEKVLGRDIYAKGGKVKENKTKKETMIAGGLLGIFLGIFLNR